MKRNRAQEYAAFQTKLILRFGCGALVSVAVVVGLYLFLWKRRVGDWIVWLLQNFMGMSREAAFMAYHSSFREYRELFFLTAAVFIFLIFLWRLFRWISRYFREINGGIEALLREERADIRLSPEMLPFERKLNTVRQTLGQRREEAAAAERRKNDLVMYLAHDIRTPLTSVIGYLSLLEEEPELPRARREKYVKIALDKAGRLEQMIGQFFEITQYNSQQIQLSKEKVDLSFLLVQLSDELSPALERRGNRVCLDVPEELNIYADPDKLARVFGNILKNAAAYSDPRTVIAISARREGESAVVSFRNRGRDIPPEKLDSLFDKFYRVDVSRGSGTGGAGLGLAIAKEIVTLHAGTIRASSGGGVVTFTVRLPAGG